MADKQTSERLTKIVGRKKTETVWAKLYRLNEFATNLGLDRAANDGYPVRKVVGKPRPRRG
ncbi:MAG: hypothetical protein DME70_09155 [Verrucomicrobia bacterium]|nr:MAG: hypothetical protein DME70_09155 [Verrucomicrobiota bacterium]